MNPITLITLQDRKINGKCGCCGIPIKETTDKEKDYTIINHHEVGDLLVHNSHLNKGVK
uniref:Uncharacterized protein n=1 Tax=viral metagenome TaxID=1070528 RepID=A0A6M3LUS3_9ZZZZ